MTFISNEIKGTKIGSCLQFTRDNKVMRYDFKDKNFYKGKPNGEFQQVRQGQDFFRGVKDDEVVAGFDNPFYGKFIKKISNAESRCSNVATLLDRIAEYAHLEQHILLGLDFSIGQRFQKPVNFFPKEIIKFMQEIGCSINGYKMEKVYEQNPTLVLNLVNHIRRNYHLDLEIYKWAYEMFMSDNQFNIFVSLVTPKDERFFQMVYGRNPANNDRYENHLSPQGFGYGCEYKSLFDYLVRADRAEALNFASGLTVYRDYRKMFREMNRVEQMIEAGQVQDGEVIEQVVAAHRANNEIEKFPKYLQVKHDIVSRNFRAYKVVYDDVQFVANVNPELAYEWNKYAVIVPTKSADVKDEGVNQDHCVASYIDKIIAGQTQIVFMRLRDNIEASLITIEIRGGAMVQVKGYKNRAATTEEKTWLKTYAKAKGLTYNA